jgi:hypothetical protein
MPVAEASTTVLGLDCLGAYDDPGPSRGELIERLPQRAATGDEALVRSSNSPPNSTQPRMSRGMCNASSRSSRP